MLFLSADRMETVVLTGNVLLAGFYLRISAYAKKVLRRCFAEMFAEDSLREIWQGKEKRRRVGVPFAAASGGKEWSLFSEQDDANAGVSGSVRSRRYFPESTRRTGFPFGKNPRVGWTTVQLSLQARAHQNEIPRCA